jgi:hypothetical protein
VIVDHDRDAIAAELDVQLDEVGLQLDGTLERGEGVLRPLAGSAPMGSRQGSTGGYTH